MTERSCRRTHGRTDGHAPPTLALFLPCLPELLSSCPGVLSGCFVAPGRELIVRFQQLPADPGDGSAAARPGAGTTWTGFRHLASRKEAERQRRSIPSAPKANKRHRLAPAAAETLGSDVGLGRSHGHPLTRSKRASGVRPPRAARRGSGLYREQPPPRQQL